MERLAMRKQLRQLHKNLVDSRTMLEHASELVGDRWMKNLFFMLACRRLIMLNLLDRELGILGLPLKPSDDASKPVDLHMVELRNVPGTRAAQRFMSACELEEIDLWERLQRLATDPGTVGRTRQMIGNLKSEVEENLSDLRFMQANSPSLRA